MLSTAEVVEAQEAARSLYPQGQMPRERRDAMREVYKEEHRRIEREFEAWLAHEFVPDLAPEVAAAIWRKAWSDAHSGSMQGVEDQYSALADIANLAASTAVRR